MSSDHLYTYQGKKVVVLTKTGKIFKGSYIESSSKNSIRIRLDDDSVKLIPISRIEDFRAEYPRGGTMGLASRPNLESFMQHQREKRPKKKAPPPPKETRDPEPELSFPLDGSVLKRLDMPMLMKWIHNVEKKFGTSLVTYDHHDPTSLYTPSGAAIPSLMVATGGRLTQMVPYDKYQLTIPMSNQVVAFHGNAVHGMVKAGFMEINGTDVFLTEKGRSAGEGFTPDKVMWLISNFESPETENRPMGDIEDKLGDGCLSCGSEEVSYKKAQLCRTCYHRRKSKRAYAAKKDKLAAESARKFAEASTSLESSLYGLGDGLDRESRESLGQAMSDIAIEKDETRYSGVADAVAEIGLAFVRLSEELKKIK